MALGLALAFFGAMNARAGNYLVYNGAYPGGTQVGGNYATLQLAVTAGPNNNSNPYTIVATENDSTATATISAIKNITLTSTTGNRWTLTTTNGGRHIQSSYNCTVTLENIILNGKESLTAKPKVVSTSRAAVRSS